MAGGDAFLTMDDVDKQTDANREKIFWARLSIYSNASLFFLKLIVGMLTLSISVVSEALHTGIDLLAACMATYAVHKSTKPPDKSHTFGHGKYEELSSMFESILIILIGIAIIYGSSERLYDWYLNGALIIAVDLGIAIMLTSTVVNIFVSRKLHQIAKKHDSIAIEADAYHLSADVWTSLGVFIGLVVIRIGQIMGITNIEFIDPILALIIAVFILKTGYNLTKKSASGLLDANLPPEEEKEIKSVIESYFENYLEYHELRLRKAGSERHIDLHLVVSKGMSIDDAHALCDRMECDLKSKIKNAKVMIHCEPCDGLCDGCRFDETGKRLG